MTAVWRHRLPGRVGRPLVAGLCLAAAAWVADPAAIWGRLGAVSSDALFGSIALHAAIVVALSWRWRAAVSGIGLRIPYSQALRLTFSATLLNMVLPTSVGGDVGRVWLGRRHGVGLALGTSAAVFDRGMGLVTLVTMVAVAAAASPGILPLHAGWLLVLPAIGTGAGLLALRLSRRLTRGRAPGRTLDGLRVLLRRPGLLAATGAVSLAGHLAAAGIAALLAHGMGIDLPFLAAAALFPATILATMVPLSIGGWGVRELAAIPLLGQAGVGADGAAAIALAFGLTQLIAAGLGAAALSLVAPEGQTA